MSTVSTFSNPMLAADPLSVVDGGDDDAQDGGGRSSPVLGVVPPSDTVKETIASLHQVRAGLGAKAGVATHLVADAGKAIDVGSASRLLGDHGRGMRGESPATDAALDVFACFTSSFAAAAVVALLPGLSLPSLTLRP